jgi:hypothetical protein
MLELRRFRSVTIAAIMALAIVLPALTAPSATAASTGTVAIHSRHCQVDAKQLYDDCHGNPGPAGAVYTIDNRVPKAIDGSGNVSFGGAEAGDHLVTLTSGFDSGAYSHLRAFCSNSVGGSGVHEATILYSNTPQFWVRLAAGSRLTCDVYFIP